jgi:hypothetical protein
MHDWLIHVDSSQGISLYREPEVQREQAKGRFMRDRA